MILPTTTVAVADGETVRLFHNTGVKPGVHLVEITAAPPAPAHSGSGARNHAGPQTPKAACRGRLRGSDGRIPEQAQPGANRRIAPAVRCAPVSGAPARHWAIYKVRG